MPNIPNEPACQVNLAPEDRIRAADRAVLYGAILAAQRPGIRLKPAIAAAAQALVPAVRAFLDGQDGDQAAQALAYARECGGEAFLIEKRAARRDG